MRKRSAPTRADILKGLQARNNGTAIARWSSLDRLDSAVELAYWNVVEMRGATGDGLFLWHCSFAGTFWPVSRTVDTGGYVYFPGPDHLNFAPPPLPNKKGVIVPPTRKDEDVIVPPSAYDGQVWCYLDAPKDGEYCFIAQVETYEGNFEGDTNYVAEVECFVDSTSHGVFSLHAEDFGDLLYIYATLSVGKHLFQIKQVSNSFMFFGVAAWWIPSVTEHQ